MSPADKPLVWLSGEVRTPPFTQAARVETGVLLRQLQRGDNLGMPQSRPMPGIGARCHELRIHDVSASWRLVYRIEPDAIVILAVFRKTTRTTPQPVMDACRRRLRLWEEATREAIPQEE